MSSNKKKQSGAENRRVKQQKLMHSSARGCQSITSFMVGGTSTGPGNSKSVPVKEQSPTTDDSGSGSRTSCTAETSFPDAPRGDNDPPNLNNPFPSSSINTATTPSDRVPTNNDPLPCTSALVDSSGPCLSSGLKEQAEEQDFDIDLPHGLPKNDIGCAIQILRDGKMSNSAKQYYMESRWQPKVKTDFPVSFHKKKGEVRPRSLNMTHMETYKWLAVSHHPTHKGAWCAVCVLFKTTDEGGHTGAQKMGHLVRTPLTNFADLTGQTGDLSRHARSSFHLQCSELAANFLKVMKNPCQDIGNQLCSQRLAEVEKNRNILRTVIPLLQLCAVQNISLRGHRDDGYLMLQNGNVINPENDGNFRHLLRYRIDAGDKAFEQHIRNCNIHKLPTYISKTTQNQLLTTMCSLLKEDIIHDVNSAEFWSILVDESTDRQTREQMVVVARYVKCNADGNYVVQEDPFAVVDAFERTTDVSSPVDGNEVKLDGVTLGKIILSEMNKATLDVKRCVGQGYDGAAALSSMVSGAAMIVKESAPYADYFHCVSHATNLSCSKCLTVTTIRNAHDIMAAVINHFNSSAKRVALLKKHGEESECDNINLLTLCTTRFVERHTAVSRFWKCLPTIVSALHEMMTWADREASSKASSLLASLERTETLVSLACLQAISSVMKPLCAALQAKGGDITQALKLLNATKSELQSMRESSETSFAEIFKDIEATAEKLGVEVKKPRLPSRCIYRSTGASSEDTKSYYRINVYIPALDAVLRDFRERFGKHTELSAGLSSLIPSIVSDKSWEDVQPAFVKYGPLMKDNPIESSVRDEFKIWQRHWSSCEKKPTTAVATINECKGMEAVFPNMLTLLTLLATLPVSTCEAERMFSKVDRTCSAIRSTMSEERLEALVLLQTHRNRLPSTEAVIDRFSMSALRKLSFTL